MKKSTLLAAVLASALLQACGGGDGGDTVATAPTGSTANGNGDSATTTTQPAASGDQGSVSAPFAVTADLSRYMIFSPSGSKFGGLTATSQAASGAITDLETTNSSITFSDSGVTKDIAGDASYALGRWVTGTITTASGTYDPNTQVLVLILPGQSNVLPGTDQGSYHYAAYNILASLPTAGNYACALQSSTTPTSGGSASTGSVSSTIALNFDDAGAHLTGNVNVTVGGETVAASVPSSITSPSSLSGSGLFLAQGTGTMVQVADAGNGNYALMVAYAAKLTSGSLYQGIAHMSCTAN
jgi:hypothetical protein